MLRATTLFSGVALLIAGACGDDSDEEQPTYTSEPQGRIAFTSAREGNDDIFVMRGDGSEQTNLTNNPDASDSDPYFSPDGERIAFLTYRDSVPDIWTMAADGSDLQQITSDPGSEAGPVWSPDGRTLAFFSSRDPLKGYLWVHDIESGEESPLLDQLGTEMTVPCKSGAPTNWPRDDYLMYQGIQADIRAHQICVVNRADSSVTLVLSKPDALILDGVLSPDGSMLAYSSNEVGNFDIWVSKSDGSNAVRLTFDPGIDAAPTWSPDGQWLAFSSQRDGDYEIYIMRPDGSDVRKLTDNDTDDTLPHWGD